MTDPSTICPHCETEGGELASPCPDAVCARNGYHFIPSAYHEPLAERVSRGAGHDPEVGRKIGSYLLLQRIGEGGMGVVYLALQMPLGRQVALKMVPAVHLRDEDRRRFEREAMSIAILYHPNIVSLIEYGVSGDKGVPYMVLEYVKGGRDLGRLMDEKRRRRETWDRESLLAIFTQILNGLGVAHKSGLVHRDIKPPNIMLVSVEGNPSFVKILDFGLVRALVDIPGVEVITSQGELWGTPQYMAPEQLDEGGVIDHRCDLYALGVILFEMLTCRRAFSSRSLNELFVQKLDAGFDPLASLPPGTVTPALEAFFRKALGVRPSDRFQSAREMKDALAAALGGAPVVETLPEPAPAGDEARLATVRQAPEKAVTPEPPASPEASGSLSDAGSVPGREGRSRAWLGPVLGMAAVVVLGVLLGLFVNSLRGGGEAGMGLVSIGDADIDDGGEDAPDGVEEPAPEAAAAFPDAAGAEAAADVEEGLRFDGMRVRDPRLQDAFP
jgi:serine/threonine protein kinase